MKLKCLLIEDNEDDALVVELKLRERDVATVKWCADRKSFEKELKTPYDAILVDFRLRDMTGQEAIRLARNTAPFTPVIIVSGSINDLDASVALQLGAADYVLKGNSMERLPNSILKAVENAALKRENEERKQKESHTERLELLGELVVGLSHDLRNVLSVILAGVEIVRPKIRPDDERILDVVTSSVRRAEQMLAQMLAFGRGDTGELNKVSTEYVVGEIASLLRAGTFPNNIRVQVRTAIGTAQIRCDESQLNRALWNLCLNAKEAMMPAGGQLTVSAQNVQLHNPEGEYVSISIKDSGKGIPKEAIHRLFEPFFTTRSGEGGTGLGLAMTKQIISAHGGKIGVTSDDKGTEFTVFLPVASEGKNSVAQFDGKGRTILLVEDEEFLRAWGKLRLENAGYKVLDAANGASAMNLFITHLDEVDVLVTDLNLPEMQGNQLAKTLRELKSELKIVYVTGLDSLKIYEPVPSAILSKPFPSIKLLEVLRDVLSTR